MIDLTLNTVCGGYLDQEFKRYLPMRRPDRKSVV